MGKLDFGKFNAIFSAFGGNLSTAGSIMVIKGGRLILFLSFGSNLYIWDFSMVFGPSHISAGTRALRTPNYF